MKQKLWDTAISKLVGIGVIDMQMAHAGNANGSFVCDIDAVELAEFEDVVFCNGFDF